MGDQGAGRDRAVNGIVHAVSAICAYKVYYANHVKCEQETAGGNSGMWSNLLPPCASSFREHHRQC